MSASDTMMVVICRCGHRMKVPAAAVGKICKCVKCAEKFLLTPENTKPLRETTAVSRTPEPADGSPAGQTPAAPDKRIGRLLIDEGLIVEKQLQDALTMQKQRGGKLLETLINLGYLGKKELHTFLSKQSGVASIDLKHYEIPHELVSLIPREFAQKNVVLPIDKMGRLLTVGMACPLDTVTIAELEKITGLKVKAMLCTFDDIHAAIERYYPSETEVYYEEPSVTVPKITTYKPSVMDRSNVVARLEQLEALPALAGTVQRVREAAAQGKSVREVAGIVCADPALTAKVLSVANSPPYGLSGRVANINLAVTLLGVAGANEVTWLLEHVPPIAAVARFDFKRFWVRSMFCAAAAMAIAKASGRGDVGDAYTAGLLHEIGHLALAAGFPESCARVAGSLAGLDLLQGEEDVFGLAHPEIGFLLAHRWKLPAAIADAIRYHHQPDAGNQVKDLVAIVALATVIAEVYDQRTPLSEAFTQRKDLLTHLGIDENTAANVFERTATTLKTAAGLKE